MKKKYFDSICQRKIKLHQIFISASFLLISSFSYSQTTIINPALEGGFENGNTISSNGWTSINPSIDSWNIGNIVSPSSGNNAAYISSDNGSIWNYSQINTVSHLAKEITVPADQPKMELTFKWKAGGEGLDLNDWDNLKVFFVPSSYNLVAGVQIPPSYQIGTLYKLSFSDWNTALISFATVPGTYKLVFSWKSDIVDAVNPPAAIDEVSLIANPPSNFISVATGNWNNATTWNTNSVPTLEDNVLIATNHTVTLDANNLAVNDLAIDGTLNYATIATNFDVKGNLTVNSGGNLNAFFNAVGKSITVSRNLINNGNIDLSKGTLGTNILTLNGIIPQTVSGSGTFTNNLIRNLTFNNTSSGGITWNYDNLRIAGNLNFIKGNVALENNTLTLGTGVTAGIGLNAVGALLHTSGGFVSGTFSRWWANTAAGTTLVSGALPIATAGRYPFVNNQGNNHSAYIQRILPTVGGQIACKYTTANSVSAVSIADGSYTVDSKYDGNWIFSTPTNVPVSESYNIALFGQNTFQASNGNSRIIKTASVLEGIHLNGTNLPSSQRTGLTLEQLTQNPITIGIATADKPNATIASGNWNDVSIWSKGSIPNCDEAVNVNSGHTITLNSASNVSKSLTISSGGTLNVTSGNLTIGCTDNNATLNLLGNLNVTGGNLNVNGNIAAAYGSVFSQSGGNINVDGNSGNIATSVADGTRIIDVIPENASSLNWTGGTLTIVDPHAATAANDVLRLSGQFDGYVNVTSGHTIKFGDGISNQSGGNTTNGFRVNTWAITSGLPLGNVIVEGPSGTNRHLTGTYQIPVYGNLTINNGGESRVSTLYLNGNAVINSGGTLTSSTGFFFVNGRFIDASTVGFTPSINAQQFTNNGIVRNSATVSTANLNNLVINNASALGVTLNSPVSLSGTMTLTNGLLNTSAANILKINHGGSVAGGSNTTFVNGPMTRVFASERTASGTYSSATQFPVGKNGSFLPLYIDPSTATESVEFKAEAFTANQGTYPQNITSLSNNLWETAIVLGNDSFINANIRIVNASISAESKIVQSETASGEYSLFSPASIVGTGTLTTVSPIIATDFKGFFSHAIENQLGTDTFIKSVFKAYPNPVKDFLNLSSSEEITSIEIYNLIGQRVLFKKVNDLQISIDLSSLSKSTYILKAFCRDYVQTVKIIKE